jgi:hypothetical protein
MSPREALKLIGFHEKSPEPTNISRMPLVQLYRVMSPS